MRLDQKPSDRHRDRKRRRPRHRHSHTLVLQTLDLTLLRVHLLGQSTGGCQCFRRLSELFLLPLESLFQFTRPLLFRPESLLPLLFLLLPFCQKVTFLLSRSVLTSAPLVQ